MIHLKKICFILLEVVQYFDRLSSTYGSPFRLFVGPQPIVYISDAKNAKIVLNSKDCLNKPDLFYKVFRESLSVDGLITLNGKYFFFLL